MRVAIIINNQAGNAHGQQIEEKTRQALFRCELTFHRPETAQEMQKAILSEAYANVDCLIVCGGDGTLNVAIQPLLQHHSELKQLPPLCIVSVGTANDLAREMKVSTKIHQAIRAVLEGHVKAIDILEVRSEKSVAYMMTNGGLGVPALTAEKANQFRQWIKKSAESNETSAYLKPAFKVGKHLIHRFGSQIYSLLLVESVLNWQERLNWELEIEIPNKGKYHTKAPYILINNQPKVGGSFTPAPLTTNNDGTFNVLMIEPPHIVDQFRRILEFRKGTYEEWTDCPTFETDEITIRSLHENTNLTFFGDGEILHRAVKTIHVRCLHPGLPLITTEEE